MTLVTNQPLVRKVDELTPSSVKSEAYTAQVLFITSDPAKLGVTSPVVMEPPPSNDIIAFYWNQFTEPPLPSYMPFQVMVKSCDKKLNIILL